MNLINEGSLKIVSTVPFKKSSIGIFGFDNQILFQVKMAGKAKLSLDQIKAFNIAAVKFETQGADK